MYNTLLEIHHYVAFIALALTAYAAINGYIGAHKEKVFEKSNRKINSFALISLHTMLLLGILLLFISPIAKMAFSDMGLTMKDPDLRKAFIEHPSINILAVILATIGNAKSKKAVGNGRKFKISYMYFGLVLVLLLSRLPFEKLF